MRLSMAEGLAGMKAARGEEPEQGAALPVIHAGSADRNGDLRRSAEGEAGEPSGRDTDDGEEIVLNADGPADDGSIAAEALLP